MSKTIEQARREAFEDWYIQHAITAGVKTTITDMVEMRGKDGEYRRYPVLHGKWIGYNAALDSLCIELPKNVSAPGVTGVFMSEAVNMAISTCREAIHAAGVKTK